MESEEQGEPSEVLVSDTHIVEATDSSVYLLFSVGNVYVKKCERATIVLGAVAGTLTIEKCENCTIVAAAHCMQIVYVRSLEFADVELGLATICNSTSWSTPGRS